ncbi:MAG: D-2-hydroxyacid dehydrogenase [Clostridiales Family XIII bacterium]|jgi:D-3-phosphoglycerate dehydrogenase|nr:D-2-hydroxyacid dehydrogenase [Clostridiales Family XIII bacterium]
MVRILATDGIEKGAGEKLRRLGYDLTEQFFEPEELAQQVKNYDALVVRSATKVRKPIIDAALESGRLKLIIRGGVGTDNIDTAYARENGIEVKNTPNASSASVAELTIGHLFALARHIHEANVTMREGKWEKKNYSGIELAGKTLGLIGMGRIGRIVAEKASALGMKICYTNRSGHKPENDPFEHVSMDELLRTSDFVSLHMPKADEPVVTAREIAKMKDGAYIVNTARGGLIPDEDILSALDSGKLSGVALDVYPEEPPKNEKIYTHPKISLTPHIGASTAEAQERVGEEVAAHITAMFA